MNGQFLIPANAKKSMLIFGYFNTTDIILLCSGIGISLILMMVLPVDAFIIAVLALMPALISAFLVFPIPNYHNVRIVIKNAWSFYTTRQRYIWRGWCFSNGERDKK